MAAKRFEGKVVIVTGSSSGIGQAVLIGFAKEGASVVVHGSNRQRIDATEQLLKDLKVPDSKYLVIQGDILKDEVQQQIIDETVKKFGQIDVLVNNAGVGGKPGVLTEGAENYDFIMNINLRAPYLLTLLAVPYLEKTRGNVINTSSITAYSKPMDAPMMSIYGASKAALDVFTKYESQKLAAKGIRINNISPGPFLTNILEKSIPENTPKEVKEQILVNIEKGIEAVSPMKRWGKMDELVPAYLLLADNNASGFTTGACWTIDGGSAHFAPTVD